jgi:hypothetical protein
MHLLFYFIDTGKEEPAVGVCWVVDKIDTDVWLVSSYATTLCIEGTLMEK